MCSHEVCIWWQDWAINILVNSVPIYMDPDKQRKWSDGESQDIQSRKTILEWNNPYGRTERCLAKQGLCGKELGIPMGHPRHPGLYQP